MKSKNSQPMATAHYRYRQRGASLLEGIAFLGIAAIVILGAVSLLSSAFSSAQSNQSTEDLVAMRTAVHKLYSGQSYPDGIAPTLIAAKAVPGSLKVNSASGTIANTWGGAVTVTGAADGATFTIQYAAVPQDVCINMVSGANGWTKVDNNGQATTTSFPVTAAVASVVCADTANTLNFTAG
jgi:type II secretory pathway pseudopilin PulG